MFTAYLIAGALAASPMHNAEPTPVEVHDQLESAAAVSASLRMHPLAGRFEIQEGSSTGDWSPSDAKSGPSWTSRHSFEFFFDPAGDRVELRGYSGERQVLSLERHLEGELARTGPNLMRVEIANFDANASVRLENLELIQGADTRSLRDFGRGVMTSDLATLWEPALAEGFVLRGTLKVDGAVRPSDARIWVDFGLGAGRRVAVDVEGYGWVRSQPAGLSAGPDSKQAIGVFKRGEAVRLEASEDPSLRLAFKGWSGDGIESEARYIDVSRESATIDWTARFDSPPEIVKQTGEPQPAPKGGGIFTFTNSAAISVPGSGTSGPAAPYPSTIFVSGPIGGAITDVNVILDGVTHTFPDDLDVLVVSPFGDAVLIMSDACGADDINGFFWRFDDEAAAPMTDSTLTGCFPFDVQPTNYGTGDTFEGSAPAGPYAGSLSAFDNENPNGTWRLFVMDDVASDIGTINDGWELEITTEPYEILIPATGTSGPADPYPSVRIVQPTHTQFGSIIDVNVHLEDVTHSFPDDLDVLIVGPSGAASILMSDACGSDDILNYIWIFDDEAPAPMTDGDLSGCNPFNVQPTNFGEGDTWPAPAPPGPFTASLAEFDGELGTGTWTLFIDDDAGSDVGFLETDWFLELTLDGIFQDDYEL